VIALFIVVAATVGISATCSLLESILMSSRVPALEAAKSGPHAAKAERLLAMKRDIGAPTSAILITNTVANTAGATLAGSIAVDAFGTGALGLFSVAFTLAILFLAEIVPKTLGAVRWRGLWRFIVSPLVALQKLLAPAVWITEKTSSALIGKSEGKATTEDEIVAMIRLGARVGELSPNELQLLTSVLRFDEMRVSEVMVPRRAVKRIAMDATVAEALAVVGAELHTRYPLCGEDLDEADALVHLKDLANPEVALDRPARELSRPLVHVPKTMAISSLLRQMQRSKQHMALVVDEFGSAAGIVTLEDLLEQIVGDVEDEFDQSDAVAQGPVDAGPRTYRGSTSLRSLSEVYDTPLVGQRVETLNGWVLEQLGRLPVVGDVLRERELEVEVMEVRRDQATKIRVSLVEGAAGVVERGADG